MAIRTIPHRELRNNSAAVLREVKAGEHVQISNHGEVVAILVPATDRAAGPLRVRQPRIRGGFADLPSVVAEASTAEALEDLRGDK